MDIPAMARFVHNDTDKSYLKVENLPILIDETDDYKIVDYLRIPALRRPESNLTRRILLRHCTLCVTGYRNALKSGKEDVIVKYKWLINYHNYAVQRARAVDSKLNEWNIEITDGDQLVMFDEFAGFRLLTLEDVPSEDSEPGTSPPESDAPPESPAPPTSEAPPTH
jgi:hypothetical protein